MDAIDLSITFSGSSTPDCTPLAHPSTLQTTISTLLFLGVIVSYIPQYHRILTRRSSEGLSPYFILLGVTSTTCGILNILILSTPVYACLPTLPRYPQYASLLGILQVGAQWGAFLLVMLLFLLFFPRASPATLTKSHVHDAPTYRAALAVTLLSTAHAAVHFLISALIYFALPRYNAPWAAFLGLQATALTSVQYFPQIWMTYRLKRTGSLSIPMMCLQTPGGFVLALSMYARLGWEGWSQWVIYLAVASCQGVLLGMAVYYTYWLGHREEVVEGGEAEYRRIGDEEDETPVGSPVSSAESEPRTPKDDTEVVKRSHGMNADE